jgi:hypothetical protein
MVLFLLGGVALLVVGYAAGWLVASLAAPAYMLIYWYKKDLRRLPAVKGETIDCVLSTGILGRLPEDPTVKDLVGIVTKERSGMFLLARFGL